MILSIIRLNSSVRNLGYILLNHHEDDRRIKTVFSIKRLHRNFGSVSRYCKELCHYTDWEALRRQRQIPRLAASTHVELYLVRIFAELLTTPHSVPTNAETTQRKPPSKSFNLCTICDNNIYGIFDFS